MKLVSINVSLAKDVHYNDKTVSTGIFKKPVDDDSVFVSQFQIDGDQQVDLVNHGGEHKAVYAFSANHYDYWRQQLAKPLHYGQFGENLTITDLDEKNLCIGDQIQIGQCVLEVTQPRVPCFKLGIALDLATMPKQFTAHGATGIYFRVITTGYIQQGDAVTIVHRHPKKLSVHSLFNAYFDKAFTNADDIMLKADTIVELSDEWRQKVQSRL